MPTEDRFTPDHPLPLFLSGPAEERGSLLLLNASILVLVASLVGMAILLSFGNPAKAFADIQASLIDISALQPGTVRSTPTIQSTADAKASDVKASDVKAFDVKALPPTERGAPARDEIAAIDAAHPSQAEIKAAPPGALLQQFEDWAAKEDARAQIETVRPVQDARAKALQNAQARVLPIQKH